MATEFGERASNGHVLRALSTAYMNCIGMPNNFQLTEMVQVVEANMALTVEEARAAVEAAARAGAKWPYVKKVLENSRGRGDMNEKARSDEFIRAYVARQKARVPNRPLRP